MKIHLGKGLSFNAREIATEVTAIYGMRGSGKSNTAAVIVEGCLDDKVQVIILDYVGIWSSLRLDCDGKTPSRFKIPVFGGRMGDIALVPTAGKLLAESLAVSGSSAVIDLTGFSKSARGRFAADFGERLFECKKDTDNQGPTLLVLEEAQRYIPQTIRPGMEDAIRSLGAFEEIAETGRNFGLGLMAITLRPQKINAEVRNLAENAFVNRTLGVHERKAIQEYVQEKDAPGREDVKGELPSLPRGTALVWSPMRGIYGKFEIPLKSTYDAGATPMHARKAVKLKPLDLGELEKSMAAIVEQAKADDPRALKAEIARLKKELTKKIPALATPKAVTKTVEVVPKKFFEAASVFLGGLFDVVKAVERLKTDGHKLDLVMSHIDRATVRDAKPSTMVMKNLVVNGVAQPMKPVTVRAGDSVTVSQKVDGWKVDARAPSALGKGERIILTAVAQHDEGVTREQLTVLTGYKRSTRDAYIQRLSVAGLVEAHLSPIQVTKAGLEALGPDFEPLPTGDALRKYHLARLPEGERKILQVLVDGYPDGWNRDSVGEATGYKRSTRDAYIQRLMARKLVEEAGRGEIRASETLFS